MREQLYNEINASLLYLDKDTRDKVMLNVAASLNRYEVNKITTELSTSMDNTLAVVNHYFMIRESEGMRKGTIANTKRLLINFLLSTNKPYDKVNSLDITIYVSREVNRGLSVNTAQNIYKAISGFYTWLVKMEIVSKNPMEKVTKIKPKKEIKNAFSSVDLEKN